MSSLIMMSSHDSLSNSPSARRQQAHTSVRQKTHPICPASHQINHDRVDNSQDQQESSPPENVPL